MLLRCKPINSACRRSRALCWSDLLPQDHHARRGQINPHRGASIRVLLDGDGLIERRILQLVIAPRAVIQHPSVEPAGCK